MSARARSRDGTRPLSTINTSRRTLFLAIVECGAGTARVFVALVAAAHDPISDGTEPALFEPGIVEDGLGLGYAVGGHCSRSFEAEQRRIAWFGARRILAGALAERRRVALDIQNVVHDLKRKPDKVSEALD